MVPKFLNLNKPWSCKYSNFHFPSDHFLYNFTSISLEGSNYRESTVWQRKKEKTGMTFLCMIAFRNKMVAHTFLLSFDNANDHLCSERDPDILLPWLRDVTILSIGQAVPSKACENN